MRVVADFWWVYATSCGGLAWLIAAPAAAEPEVVRITGADLSPRTRLPWRSTPRLTIDQLQQPPDPSATPSPPSLNPFRQTTSVNQLADISPTDWAYKTLQSLAERYSCGAGELEAKLVGRDGGRLEVAQALNACLGILSDRSAPAEDLAAVRRLQLEFARELAVLQGRVNNLATRSAALENQQFSPTTRFTGEAIVQFGNAFQGTAQDVHPVVQDRVRLRLTTSLTGKDQLNLRLDAGNGNRFPLGTAASAQVTEAVNFVLPNHRVFLGWMSYNTPMGPKLNVHTSLVGGIWSTYVPTLNPFLESFTAGSRALTEFGSSSPIYRIGGRTGVGLNYKIRPDLLLSTGYFAGGAANPLASTGGGFLNSQYAALGQLTWRPGNRAGVGLTYIRAYQNRGNLFDMGLGNVAVVGTGVANRPFGSIPFTSNSFGVQGYYQFRSQFALSGFWGYTQVAAARTPGTGSRTGDIYYYSLGFAFPNVFKLGHLGGLVVGAQPYLGNLPPPNNRVPLHLEGFYRYQVNDNLAITPGIIWLIAPGQNSHREPVVIGVIRTRFSF